MLPVKSRISRKPNLLNDDPVDVSGGTMVELAAMVLGLEAKSRRREQMVLDVVKLTRVVVEALGKERSLVAGASRHRQNDVSTGCNAKSLRRCCGGNHSFWRFWCDAAGLVCQTFSSFSRCV